MTRVFAYFITDHGYGHATRSCSIIKEILNENDIKIIIITSISKSFIEEKFEEKNLEKVEFLNYKVDVGVHQTSSVEIDIKKTLSELEIFWNSAPEKIEKISSELKRLKCEKIIFDISSIACEIGSKLNLKTFGISNFTWDWIYSDYIDEEKKFELYKNFNLKFYQKADYFIKLPYFTSDKTFDIEKTKFFQADW